MLNSVPMPLDAEAIEDLPPELTGALTFHLPLELAALELAGADASIRAARAEVGLAEAYAAGLVDPPLYRWAVEHYRPVASALLDADAEVRAAALVDIASLADGLAGAAFHGLIRLGYGLWRHREIEVARGLAYLRTRRQVLAAPAPAAGADPDLTGRDGVAAEALLPTEAELAGAAVFDLMNLAAGIERPARLWPAGDGPLTIRRLAAAAGALAGRNPSSFVAVHTVTGLHGLCELAAATIGVPDAGATLEVHDEALGPWWRAYRTALGAASLLMGQFVPEGLPAVVERVDTPDRLLRAAARTGETHDVKLVLALSRLHQFGVITEEQVLGIGARKLAATECAAH